MLVLLMHHQQEYLSIYVIYICIIIYYITFNFVINITLFMFYVAIFAPLGELKRSVLKVYQSRRLGQEQTATCRSLQTSPRKPKYLQRTARPLAQVLCHHRNQSSLGESLTKGAT